MLETAEAPLIDEMELARSMDVLGEERLVPILHAFAATVMDEAWAVASAIAAREPARAGRLAHAMKGAACNLSAIRLARAAEALEKVAPETIEQTCSGTPTDAPALALLLATARETGEWIASRFPE